ncbi:hypothetical protein AT15_05600 [Kosmotoga arenicorallina S304]|uniref:HTH lacI-type domain-containing protein n=1 Tax=Kosmotoga arenicorallina S304 TaxID=1453497 RepID=A0A182C806_9BACT|nr:LacI family DNA-binding transcriptional regulator [Kosmotoga arenicorallina]OAA31548.1 hypothetical protein AT15_05600 [Kosmotoga arenicorallina S304]
MEVNLKYIANLANVSVSTASRALRDDPRVSEETKKRIVSIARSLNYIPNQAAKSLVTRQTMTIGLVLPNLRSFMHDIFDGIEEICSSKSYNILLGVSDNDPEKELREMKLLVEKRVDGIILFYIGGVYNQNSISFLKNLKVPIVLVDRYIPNTSFDFVVSDNRGGSRMLVKHLAELGHEKIGFIFQKEDATTITERLEGFTYSIFESGIKLNPDYIVSGEVFRTENGYRCMKKLMSLTEPPTAVIGSTGDITLGIVKYLLENPGLEKDITVAGFDDFDFLSYLKIPVTAVAQSTHEMGKRAAEILLDRITGKKFQQQKVFLEPTLVKRSI